MRRSRYVSQVPRSVAAVAVRLSLLVVGGTGAATTVMTMPIRRTPTAELTSQHSARDQPVLTPSIGERFAGERQVGGTLSAASWAQLVQDWSAFEQQYQRNYYHGSHMPGTVHQAPGTTPVLFSAPHAVGHWRETRMKVADVGTGGLTDILHTLTGASTIVQAGAAIRDGNWYPNAELKRPLARALDGVNAVIDLHGMRDNYGIDVCIGLGALPETSVDLARILDTTLRKHGIQVAVNDPFNATHPGTVTSFCQSAGTPAVQLEIARKLRTPGTRQSLALVSALAEVTQLHASTL